MAYYNPCPECGGDLIPRTTPGFAACADCGKLVVSNFNAKPPTAQQANVIVPGMPDPDEVDVDAELSKLLGTVPEEVEAQVEDAEDVVCKVGWRAWEVLPPKTRHDTVMLRSVTHSSTVWLPRQVTEATCERHSHEDDHHVPEERCSCGLYSAKDLEHLRSMGYHSYDPDRGRFTIVGEVNLWGKVIEGSQGWRAQFGYPKKLYVPFEVMRLFYKPLKETYGVPVELKNYLDPIEQKEKA
jgi:hypothetical protein